jgi:hypothetical protein
MFLIRVGLRNASVRLSQLAALGAFALAAACASDVVDTPETPLASEALGPDFRAFGLERGTRETLVDGITSVENILFTSDGRLFASGDDGIFELQRDATSHAFTKTNLHPGGTCKFGGMVELGDALYANCYDGTDSFVYAGVLTAHPTFASIFTLKGVALANGLAADQQGGLYVTVTIQGSILRVQLAKDDPFKVTGQETWLSNTGPGGTLPNGIKIVGDWMYYDDLFGTLSRVSVSRKPRNPQVLIHEFAWFDDLFVDGRGILVADYFFGAVRAYDLNGRALSATALGTFTNPSAVLPADSRLGLAASDLIVTEKGANRISIFHARP